MGKCGLDALFQQPEKRQFVSGTGFFGEFAQ